MPKSLPFTTESTSRNVHTVRMDVSAGWEQWFLLSSDRHHDNPHTDQALEKKHLEQAKERNAGIIDNGDSFCAMQGRYDKRSDKSQLRKEHQVTDYFDALVKTAAEFYRPYAHNWIVMAQGNHETSILKNHETNLNERLVERLNTLEKAHVQLGGYGGWVRFLFTIYGTSRTSKKLHYFHGTGGGGAVTRGVIQTNRMAVYLPDADIVLTGHTHDEFIVPITRRRISDEGTLYNDECLHVRCPSYKDGIGDGYAGWETEKMLNPKPVGALWLRFFLDSGKTIGMEVTRAK